MCGIFGGIYKPDVSIIRALAIANRERGTDSLGFFDSRGKIVKVAGDPMNALPCCAEFLTGKHWFIAGHTRAATRGAKTAKNAHPFRYGRFIGAHNGIVDAPRQYAVDSQYLIHLLEKYEGDYQAAFDGVWGYWGLSWFDGSSLFLQAWDNEIALGRAPSGAWYYSSDVQHLTAVADLTESFILRDGATVQFTPTGPKQLKPFLDSDYGYWEDEKRGTFDDDWQLYCDRDADGAIPDIGEFAT